MFSTKRSREVDEFAVTLARDFASRFPPGTATTGPAIGRLAKAIDDIGNRAAAFQRERRLGMYGRAKVGTSFKLELKQAGYPDDFVDDLTRQVLLMMSGK